MTRKPIDLVQYGVLRDRADLVELLMTEYQAIAFDRAFDEFLCNPRDAIDFCDSIRNRTDLKRLPDNVILRLLMNRRKQGALRS